jgi:hypothetical protein
MDARRYLLPGRSTRSIIQLTGIAGGVAMILVIVLAVGMAVRGLGYGSSVLLSGVMILLLFDGVLVVPGLIGWAMIRNAAENRAGYTTGANVHQQLMEIDPATGRIVRLAGEPFPSADEYARRKHMIREAVAREESPR